MDAKVDSAQIEALVMHTLVLHAGQPVDTILLSLAEVLARILAVTDMVTPDEGLCIVNRVAREWLRSGRLIEEDWTRQAERVRVQ